jgi:hypothetical protein
MIAMMKKTFFLCGLFLTVFAAANISAQVRIGGEKPPHPSSVLDLNPRDGTNGIAKGGLLLPRVRLDNGFHTTVFGDSIFPSRGLMVYNLNEENDKSRPKEGIYCFNGEKWVVGSSAESLIEFHITGDAFFETLWLGNNGETAKTIYANVLILQNGRPISLEDCEYWWIVAPNDGSDTVTVTGENPLQSVTALILDVTKQPFNYTPSPSGTNYDVFLKVRYKEIAEYTALVAQTATSLNAAMPITISITDNMNLIWLGHDGHAKTVHPNIQVMRNNTPLSPEQTARVLAKCNYWWLVISHTDKRDTVVINGEEPLSTDITWELNATNPDRIQGVFYEVYLNIRYNADYSGVVCRAVAGGVGAWITDENGNERWLQVANANLGAIQTIPFEEQLNLPFADQKWENIGYGYQWSSRYYWHNEDSKGKTIDSKIDVSNTNETNGQYIGEFSDGNRLFIQSGISEGDWRGWYPLGYASDNLPPKWMWDANAEPDGTPDPCRINLGDRWRVMSYRDWEQITENTKNSITSYNFPDYARGIIISVEGGYAQWFLPETKKFTFNGELETDENRPQKVLRGGYWFNEPSGVGAKSLIFNYDSYGGVSPSIVFNHRVNGLRIRCVAD